MIILVPEINCINFLLYFIFSFFCKVKAYNIQPVFLRRFKGKIELLKISEYFNWEEISVIRSDGVKTLKNFSELLKSSDWQVKIRKRDINLLLKAKQDFQKDIESLLVLKNVLSIDSHKAKIYIINSLKFDFLSRIDKDNKLFCYPTLKTVSDINILLNRINLALMNLCRLAKLFFQFIFGLLYNKKHDRTIRYVYDGVSPKELSTDKNKITFTWIIDDNLMRRDDILFVLPKLKSRPNPLVGAYINEKELFATNNFDMNIFASPKILLSCLLDSIMLLKNILFSVKFEDMLKTRYTICIMKWLPLVESLKPEVYISNDSKLNIEEPAVIYFKAIGIKTIMWLYGINSYPILSSDREAFLDTFEYCNILSDALVVWNKHFGRFIKEHPQAGLNIKILGPVMCGDESVMNLDKKILLRKLNKSYLRDSKYLALFDIPAISQEFMHKYREEVGYPLYFSEEANYILMKNIYQLLSIFPNMILIYKPKRDLTNRNFFYSDRSKRMLNKFQEAKNAIILEHDINPWIPIALADMCISLPFGSPSIAALHYGKPAIFHDPLNTAHYHRLSKINALITHNFEQLKERIELFLFNPTGFEEARNTMDISDFIGSEFATNSSEKFRQLLNKQGSYYE